MIEEIKELMTIVEKLPSMTLWVLGGFAAYKLLTMASILAAVTGCFRLLVNRTYDYLSTPRKVQFNFKDLLITSQTPDIENKFRNILKSIINPQYSYVFSSDMDWLESAVREKKEREKQDLAKKPNPSEATR